MDLAKLGVDEMRGFELPRISEIEADYRKELANLRMDIFQAEGAHAGKVRALKKNLARLLTVKNEKLKRQKKES